MQQYLGLTAVVVEDYDDAIAFYTDVLGFDLIEDIEQPAQKKRWVVVAPPGSTESRVLLARAVGDEQASRIGNQTGGRVFLFLYTDDFERDYRRYRNQRRYLRPRAENRVVRNGRRVRRPLRQPVGPVSAGAKR